MTKLTLTIAGAIAAGALTATMALADTEGAVKARQAHMDLYAHNLGILGSMAKGATDYDAEAATAAANNLVALSRLNQAGYWPQGSSTDDYMETRALPELWSTYPAVVEKGEALGKAIDDMAASAGGGLEALQAAMGPLGAACGGCHKAYRQPE